MTSPSATQRPTSDTSTIRAVLAEARGDPWTLLSALLAFLLGTLATWTTLRVVAWDALKSNLASDSGLTVIAVTPWDVILLQARVAALVGFVLAAETVVYRCRHVLQVSTWLRGASVPSSARVAIAVAVLGAFPVGALLGYRHVFPVVGDALTPADGTVTIVRQAGFVCYTAIGAGLLAQLTTLGVMVGFLRRGGTRGGPEPVDY